MFRIVWDRFPDKKSFLRHIRASADAYFRECSNEIKNEVLEKANIYLHDIQDILREKASRLPESQNKLKRRLLYIVKTLKVQKQRNYDGFEWWITSDIKWVGDAIYEIRSGKYFATGKKRWADERQMVADHIFSFAKKMYKHLEN